MNKQQLAAKIWESANKMRSKIEANEYKDYILGFIFYKFLSEKEVKYLKANDWTDEYLPELTEEDTDTVESIQKNLGYFISYDNLFSTWLAKGSDFSVQDVRDALSAFSRLINPTHKKVFEGVFDTLQTGLSKLGDSAASQSKSISELIQLIKDIPMDGKQGYDVLGFIYEYLIEKFAANAGKKAGEFYTPHEVSLLMSEIVANHLKNREKIEIFDPTSGSGSLLINIGKSASKFIEGENKVKYYAQELKQNTYNLTRMNLVMRGIEADNIVTRNGDTLEDDWPYFDENDPTGTYNPLYVDAVVSNPPYSQAWNPADKDTDPRYAGYGLAPKGKADYAFLLHDLYHIKPDGIMTIVLPHGVLFRGGEEGEIRKNLIEKNKIDTIIGLPANIFYGTGIPTIIMVLKQKRTNTDVLIVDQYFAASAISDKVAKAKWEGNNQLGGYIWHTTGSGKTMTSFKSAQLIASSKDADKVIFLMDRIELGTQSLKEYRGFADENESVQATENTNVLITKLKSSNPADTLIVTSIQKMSNIKDEAGGLNARDIELISEKRIVFIVDEAHRSTFGDMLLTIKNTFPKAMFFGFTGTPIQDENQKKKNTTSTVFGNELHRYSIADGIRDKNVLGFDPYKVLTFKDKDVRKVVALEKAKAQTEEEAISDPVKSKIFYKYMDVKVQF